MTTKLDLEFEAEALEDEDDDMATFEHGVIVTNLIVHLAPFVKANNLGRVVDSSPEYRYLEKLKKDNRRRRNYRQPDVSFVKQERLPKRFRSYPDIAPDLAVEVASPGDKDYEIEGKIAEYQQAGVSLVWIIHPFSRRVDVYRPGSGLRPQIYMGEDELNGEEVIPGFKLPVSAIFDYPADANPEPDIPE
jgi:Uma2 family endonuclease